MIYLKVRIKSLLTGMSRIKSLLTRMSKRRSLHSELKVLMANVMASSIKLEAICITTHLPHGSIYYIASSFLSSMYGVLKYCGLVAFRL